MKIDKNCVVAFHYSLTGEDGEQMESSRAGEPMRYLHGAGNIIPGLEKAMSGRAVGDTFKATVEPAEAYGERSQAKVQRIPAKRFNESVRRLMPGQPVMIQTQQGQVQAIVVKVGRFNVDVDLNHPLAGRTLTFDVEVMEVREATEDEASHGHVHGPGGVEH